MSTLHVNSSSTSPEWVPDDPSTKESILTVSKYATLSLSKSDRARFMGFPEEVYQGAEAIFTASWPPGIKSESQYAGSYEYQMKGRPWGMLRKGEAIGSRVLLRDIFRYLYDKSWILTTSISLSEKIGSKDTLLFKKAEFEMPKVDWLAVQFHWKNKMYLHCPVHSASSTSRTDTNAALIASVRDVLLKLDFLDKGEWGQNHDAYEFSLKGSPWRCHGKKSMKTRRLLLEMAGCLDGLGWESYGTVKQRTESDDWRVCDTWYFTRKVDDSL